MKTIIATVAAAFFALNVAAHNPGIAPDNYCVKSINGKMVVEKNGNAIKKEIKFKDGTCLEPDGTVIMTSGKRVMLKEGECVNETSVLNLDKHRNENWHKKGVSDKGANDHGIKDNTKDHKATKDQKAKPEKKKSADDEFDYDYPKK
jgi:hypothetical protein